MTLEELRDAFRRDADDAVAPYLFGDEAVDASLSEAEEEAAVRADLLFESDAPALCQIAVAAGTGGYALHPLMLRVTYATFTAADATEPCELKIIDRIELDRIRPNWRTTTEEPRHLMVEANRLRLGCIPASAGTLRIEGYRLPMEPMTGDSAEPEIPAYAHRHLVQWALYRAYSKPDTETVDLQRAGAALAAFEAFFGKRPDADMRRAQEARPPINKIYL